MSLSVVSLRFLHVVTGLRIPFFFEAEQYSVSGWATLFGHPPLLGTWVAPESPVSGTRLCTRLYGRLWGLQRDGWKRQLTRHSGKRGWWGRRGRPDLSLHTLHGVVVVNRHAILPSAGHLLNQ